MSSQHDPRPWPQVPLANKEHNSAAVVIIGAGMSGICMAIDLLKKGCSNFVILEQSSGIGGTWLDNKYPGCRCDIWSLLYSYSFEQNPDWTREYPGQEEILQYLIHVASKYELYRYIRFNHQVDSCTWDDLTERWLTHICILGEKQRESLQDYTISSDFLVSAMGQLNVPRWPNFEGSSDFAGKIMHSARWDWTYDMRGKRIALVGSGATAAQVVPEVAKIASKLTIYQRTPTWVVRRSDTEVPTWKKLLYRYLPPSRWQARAAQMDLREATFDAFGTPGSDMEVFLRSQCLELLHEAFPDRVDLQEKLTPKYHLGCKRVVLSDDYYTTIAKDHVCLETDPIQRFTSSGIVVANAETGKESSQNFDLIVLATGFQTTNFMHTIRVTGRNGRSLSDVWDNGARAYYGITVPDLPNFGMLYGPNTNLGHNSVILMMEAQSKYITEMISAILEARGRSLQGNNDQEVFDGKGATLLSLTPKQKTVDHFNDILQRELQETSFADPNCSSWYKDRATGKIINNWSQNVINYQKQIETVNWDDYENGEIVTNMRKGEKQRWIGRVREETRVGSPMLLGLSAAIVGIALIVRNSHALSRIIRG